jgi:hypothetical protein
VSADLDCALNPMQPGWQPLTRGRRCFVKAAMPWRPRSCGCRAGSLPLQMSAPSGLRVEQGSTQLHCWHPDPHNPRLVSLSLAPPAVALQQAGLVAVRHGTRGTQLQRAVWQPCCGGGDDPAFPGKHLCVP